VEYSLTHSLTHTLTHSLIHSYTHSLTHSLTQTKHATIQSEQKEDEELRVAELVSKNNVCVYECMSV